MQKDNPNPTVHETQKFIHPSHYSSTVHLLGSGEIRRSHLGGSPSSSNSPLPFDTANASEYHAIIDEDDYSPHWGLITAEERSVALALSEAAYPTTATSSNYYPSSSAIDSSASSTKLDILQQAGFALYHPHRIQNQCTAIRYPSFAPSSTINSEKISPLTPGEDKVQDEVEENKRDKITKNEVFQIIRNIQDPEHPLTLEQLNVVRLELVEVVDLKGGDSGASDADVTCASEVNENGSSAKKFSTVHVQFTPTIPHCSMATLIGLSLRVKLLRSLPSRFKISVKIESGTHVSEHAVNKQLADKERVRAALENEHLVGVVNRCIAGGMQMQ